MSTPINELDLQRCVDGELPALERKSLLERIETTPDGWKTLALAFLENQDFNAAGVDFRQTAPATPSTFTSKPSEAPRRSSTWSQPLALAASVAVAFWVGRQAVRPEVNIPLEDEASIASQTYAPTGEQRNAMKPAAMLELPFRGEDSRSLAIPVYDRHTLASEGPEISRWRDLRKRNAPSQPGYSLTSERNVISIPLETGETVHVPVEVSGVRYAVQ